MVLLAGGKKINLIGSIWGERLKSCWSGSAAAAPRENPRGLICSYAGALLIHLSRGKHKVHFQVTEPEKEGEAPKRSRSWRNAV